MEFIGDIYCLFRRNIWLPDNEWTNERERRQSKV